MLIDHALTQYRWYIYSELAGWPSLLGRGAKNRAYMGQPPEDSAVPDRPTVGDHDSNPAVTASGKVICPDCGVTYQSVTHHLALSGTCSYPHLTARQQEVLAGVLLARGGVHDPEDGSGCLRLTDQNRIVLEWIRDQLEWVGGTVSEKPLDDLPGEQPTSDTAETTSCLRTHSHPDFSRWRQRWHTDNGGRTTPERIHRTRRMLRTTFVLTGRYRPPADSQRAAVSFAFGRTTPESGTLERIFTGFGPTITREEDHKTGTEQVNVRLNDILSFYDFIGWNPIRGAKDQWPSPDEREQIESRNSELTECPECGGKFAHLSAHFYDGQHSPPQLDTEMKAVVAGCIIAGGRTRTPQLEDRGYLSVSVADEDRLKWVTDRFSWLGGNSFTEVEAEAVNEQMAILAGDSRSGDIEASSIQTHQTRSHHELVEYTPAVSEVERSGRYPTNPLENVGGPVPDHPGVLGAIIALRGFIASQPDGSSAYLAVNPNRTRISAISLQDLFADIDTRFWDGRNLVVTPQIDQVLSHVDVPREILE